MSLKISGLCKSFKGTEVLKNIGFELKEKGFLGVLGPSGSGKTTLLRCISGLENPDSGVIYLNGRKVFDSGKVLVPPNKRKVSLVFQNLALWPHMNTYQHLDFVLAKKIKEEERREKIYDLLKRLELENHVNSYPQNLSLGQQQRVALARALIQEPKILLLDEPLSNIDVILKKKLKKLIFSLHKKFSLTSIYVTHNFSEIENCDYLGVLKEGKLIQFDNTLEVLKKPKNGFVREILGLD